MIRRWGIAVVLHGLWDMNPPLGLDWKIWLGALVVAGWYLILAISKQALAEVALAKKALSQQVSAPLGA
ncbi:MAG: hypothetical protein JNK60_00410 [Acidobacteria bacterium]|nr:hypothetical protein [Acidobacteriota bacterium]